MSPTESPLIAMTLHLFSQKEKCHVFLLESFFPGSEIVVDYWEFV